MRRSGGNLHTRRPTLSDRNDPESGETDVASVGQASGRLKSYASELTRIKNRRSILPVHFRSRASLTRDHFLGTANIWSIMDLTDFRAEQGPTVFANQRDHHCALADAPRGEGVSLGQAFLGRLPMSFRRFVFPSDPQPSRRAHKDRHSCLTLATISST